MATKRSSSQVALVLPALWAAAGGVGCQLGPSGISAAEAEFEALRTAGAVRAEASVAPKAAKAGEAVSLLVVVRSARAALMKVRVDVRGPGGAAAHSLAIDAQEAGPESPISSRRSVPVAPGDAAGDYTVSIAVIHAATGRLLLEAAAADGFTVIGTASADGGAEQGGGSMDAGGGPGDGGGGACGQACSDAGAPVEVPAGSWLSGASSGSAADGTFGEWRGRRVEIGGTWSDASVDAQTELWAIAPGGEWSGWTGPLDLAVGGIYKSRGESWAKAAGGAYDARWRKMLQDIESYRAGKGATYLRFAHEFNGGYWEDLWQVTESEVADFKATWKRFRALQREVLPEAKLVWCANDGTGSGIRDIRTAYPGSEYVDILGIDTYNGWPYVSDATGFEAKWSAVSGNGAPLGPESWRRFAEAQGVPLGIGEWGSHAFDDGGSGGGDSPAYMQGMRDWLQKHGGTGPGQIEYEVFFNLWSDFELYPTTSQPHAAAKYRELW